MPELITRVYGPYPHKQRWRCQIEVNGSRRWAPLGKTQQQAEDRAHLCLAALYAANPVTVDDAIERYRGYLTDKGNKPESIENASGKLRRFFLPVLAVPVVRLTKIRAAALYHDLRTVPSERTGKPLSADSHRNILAESKTFLGWCVEQRLLGNNPLASVKGVGKRKHGKPQLRIDEARKLRALCHARAAGRCPDGAPDGHARRGDRQPHRARSRRRRAPAVDP